MSGPDNGLMTDSDQLRSKWRDTWELCFALLNSLRLFYRFVPHLLIIILSQFLMSMLILSFFFLNQQKEQFIDLKTETGILGDEDQELNFTLIQEKTINK